MIDLIVSSDDELATKPHLIGKTLTTNITLPPSLDTKQLLSSILKLENP